MFSPSELYQRRKKRQRYKLSCVSNGERHRVVVHRTNNHIYAQLVDVNGVVVAQASTLDKNIKGKIKTGGNIKAAECVGESIANIAKSNNIVDVVFDRSGYLYHGRVKALADSARQHGLNF